jgi:hypothetical protein
MAPVPYNNKTHNNKHAYAGTNDCFTHLRALLVLRAPRHFGTHTQQAALLGMIPPTEYSSTVQDSTLQLLCRTLQHL